MKTYIEKVKDLDYKTYRRLYRLNNSFNKLEFLDWVMRPTLVAFKNDNPRYWNQYRALNNPDAYAVYVKNEKGTIVSWSMLINTHNYWQAMFFTSTKYRQRGYGRVVFNEALRFCREHFKQDFKFFPHDYTATKFFRKLVDEKIFNNYSDCFEYAE